MMGLSWAVEFLSNLVQSRLKIIFMGGCHMTVPIDLFSRNDREENIPA